MRDDALYAFYIGDGSGRAIVRFIIRQQSTPTGGWC
jgi:hypothetical protein